MSKRRTFLLVASILLVSACSSIPDPADAPNVEPYEILQRLRCEVKEVLDSEYPPEHWVRRAVIGYGLTLTAEENRDETGLLSAVWPIHLGTVSLEISGGAARKRIGESKIDFAEALSKPVTNVCTELPISNSERFYPITGQVGLSEIIRRFVRVKEIGGTLTKDTGFVHTLDFTLKFNGGIKPSFSIARVNKQGASGNLNLTADRSDRHQLILKLEPPPVPTKPEEAIKVEIVKLPPPPNAPPGYVQKYEEKRTTEIRGRLETAGEATSRAEQRMIRGLQEERRLRLDENVRDLIRDSEQ